MRKIKDILLSILNIYSVVSLFIHEASHIFMIYLLGGKVSKISIKKREHCSFSVLIDSEKDASIFKTFLISFSPIFALILVGVLSIFSNFFLILFIYLLTTLRKGYTLPSSVDIDSFKNSIIKYRSRTIHGYDYVEEDDDDEILSFVVGDEDLYVV